MRPTAASRLFIRLPSADRPGETAYGTIASEYRRPIRSRILRIIRQAAHLRDVW